MIYVLKYHFAIFVFIFNVYTLCQGGVLDHEENEDSVRLSPEEILRRRKLVESYLSEIEEKQKDWIETNHMVLPKNIHKDANYPKDSQLKEEFNADVNVQAPPTLKIREQDYSDAVNPADDPDSLIGNEKWKTFKKDYLDPKYSSKSQINETEFEIRRAIFWSSYAEIVNSEYDFDTVKDPLPDKTFSSGTEAKLEKKLPESQTAVNSDKRNTKDKGSPVIENLEKNSDRVKDPLPDKTFSAGTKTNLGKNLRKSQTAASSDKINSKVKGSTHYYMSEKDFCLRRNLNFYLTKTCDAKESVEAEHLIPQANEQNISIFVDRKGEMPNDEIPPNFSKGIIVHKSESPEFKSSEIYKENSIISGRDAETDTRFSKDIGMNHQKHELTSKPSDNLNKISADAKSIVRLPSSREISSGINQNSFDSELIKRQNIYNSYQSELNKKQENYIETNHFIYSDSFMSKSDISSFYEENGHNFQNYHKDYSNSQCSQERQYFMRWVKMLLNKYSEDLLNEDTKISFSFSSNSLNKLKSLSLADFDVTVLDEVFSDLISNATLTNGYQLSFTFMNYMPSIYFILYILVLCLCIIIFLPHVKFLFLIFVVFFLCIVLNGFKLYQKKVAEKHAILSSIEPSYCQSILSHESGLWAHAKEYVRQSFYGDKCERYYNALMIDPLSEITFPVIVADLLSDTFYHAFQSLGRLLNTIFRDLTRNLGYFDYFVLLIVLIFVFFFFVIYILSSLKYRLVLPFFMGSLEPSPTRVGSRVEEVKLEEDVKNLPKSFASSNLPQLNYTTVIHLADVYKESYVRKENDLVTAAIRKPCNLKKHNLSKMLVRRLSF